MEPNHLPSQYLVAVAIGCGIAMVGYGLISVGVLPSPGVGPRVWLVLLVVITVPGWIVYLVRGTARRNGSFLVSETAEEVLLRASVALGSMKATRREQTAARLVAETGPTIASLGERIVVTAESEGPGSVRVLVESRSRMPTGIDWGKNQRNVIRVVSAIQH